MAERIRQVREEALPAAEVVVQSVGQGLCYRVCPICSGPLQEIRHKLQCRQCHTILETCCEGGRG
jgi:hypothetical protein